MKFTLKPSSGFTLIELLIVISIIAILAGGVFVALNPLARFEDSRNARRWADSNAVLSAIKLDQVDHGGAYLDSIDDLTANLYYQIGEAASGCNETCSSPSVTLSAGCVDLLDLIDRGYIADIPVDPNASGRSSQKTGYYVYKYDSGQISVGSCHEEKGTNAAAPTIEVSR
jgi:prepilin-type N-terminal cleavage/methylation domain-containing protein